MLKKINPNTVQGSGFTVHIPDVHEVRYEDADGMYTIEIEGGNMGGNAFADWLVYSRTLSKIGARDAEVISLKKRSEILDRIGQCLSELGMRYEIV